MEVIDNRCTGSVMQKKFVMEATAQQSAQGWPSCVVCFRFARGQVLPFNVLGIQVINNNNPTEARGYPVEGTDVFGARGPPRCMPTPN